MTSKAKEKKGKSRKGQRGKDLRDASDRCVHLTEVEALRFGKLDAEMRNALQGLRLADADTELTKREYASKVAGLQEHKQQLVAKLASLRATYEPFVSKLAEKYGMKDPKSMSVDPDTGVIRDLTKT